MATKIIKPGTKIFVTECDKCDCVFQYDISDVYTGFSYSYVHCPHCNETIPHKNRKKRDEVVWNDKTQRGLRANIDVYDDFAGICVRCESYEYGDPKCPTCRKNNYKFFEEKTKHD